MATILAAASVASIALANGGAPVAADPASTKLTARLAAVLERAGLISVQAGWHDGRLKLGAEAPGYKDPMVALGVMGTVAARLAPDAGRLSLRVRKGQRAILELTTTPSGLQTFVEARFSAAQRGAVEQALRRVRWDRPAPQPTDRPEAEAGGSPAPELAVSPPAPLRAAPEVEARRTTAPPQPPRAAPETTSGPSTVAGPGFSEARTARDIAEEGTLAELFEEAAQRGAALQETLVGMGLENVRVIVRPGAVVVAYENRVFRNELTGLGMVLGAAAEVALADAQIVAVPKRRNIPVIAVTAEAEQVRRFMRGESKPKELRDSLRVSQDVAHFLRPEPGDEETKQANRSRLRLEFTGEPHVKYRLGQTEDPFIADLLFQPGAEVQLGRGALAAVRGDIIVDEADARWDRAYVSRVLRPGDRRLLFSTTLGQIAPHRRAWHSEGLFTTEDDRWRFGGSFTRLGENLFDLEEGVHSRSLLGMVEYEVQPLELTLRGSGGQFLFGDRGVRLDLVRRFGEREVAVTGIHTNLGNRWGINVRVPLGPRELPAPRCGRLRWAEDADIGYYSTTLAVGETIDYDFSLRAFRDELTGPYVLEHPEELRAAVGHLREAEILPAEVPTRAPWERKPTKDGPPWPSLLGRSGLLFIPTADTLGDGQYAIGSALIDRKHTVRKRRAPNTTSSVAPYAGFGFLPGVEIGMRYTIYPSLDAYDWGYSTNRAPYAHVRLLRERDDRPAVAAFVEDPTGSPVEEAYGGVVSKDLGGLRWTLGWGEGRFDGLFGGVCWPLGSRARVVGEYDSRFFNLGAGAHLGPLYFQGAILDLDGVAGGVSYWGQF